ncbi:MAG TPA: WYL domain-containing protein, partial [Blastococcus sp.]
PGGAPGDLIDLEFEGETVTVLDPQTLDRPLRLTVDEAQALVVAARTLADVPGLAERDALDRVLAKLEDALGVGDRAPGVAVAIEAEADVLATARTALDDRRRLHLRYLVEARDEVTDRDVDPMRLLSREGRWYLEAWCRRVEGVRLFRLDRVDDVVVLDEPAAPPPEAHGRNLDNGVYQPEPDAPAVRLRLARNARWVADYYPVDSVAPVEDPPGGLAVTLRTADLAWARRLVASLGGAAVADEPGELAAQVAADARAALARYGVESPQASGSGG